MDLSFAVCQILSNCIYLFFYNVILVYGGEVTNTTLRHNIMYRQTYTFCYLYKYILINNYITHLHVNTAVDVIATGVVIL